MDITLTRPSGSGRVYLRFAKTEYNEHGLGMEKVGFKLVDPTKNSVDVLAWAKGQSWRFGTQNRQNQQYEVLIDSAEMPEDEEQA